MLLRLEGAGVLAAAIAVYAARGQPWWVFALFFFAPDLSILAYLAGPRLGAAAYNTVHTYVLPLALAAFAALAGGAFLLGLAIIWAGHIGFDRMLGYGLKYPASFKHTHLGRIGRAAPG